ncbi:hypothetical protein AB0D97_35130 [Streptomyces roseus]
MVGILNPAFGNTCVNASGHKDGHYKGEQHGEY